MEITFDGGKVVTAHTHGLKIMTDQPVDNGGQNSAPTPFDLFLASIGTCAGIYVKSFCDNRKIPTDGIKLVQTTSFSKETGLPTHIIIDIQVPPDFPEKYRSSLINVAELCKVKKTMAYPPVFEVLTSVI